MLNPVSSNWASTYYGFTHLLRITITPRQPDSFNCFKIGMNEACLPRAIQITGINGAVQA